MRKDPLRDYMGKGGPETGLHEKQRNATYGRKTNIPKMPGYDIKVKETVEDIIGGYTTKLTGIKGEVFKKTVYDVMSTKPFEQVGRMDSTTRNIKPAARNMGYDVAKCVGEIAEAMGYEGVEAKYLNDDRGPFLALNKNNAGHKGIDYLIN